MATTYGIASTLVTTANVNLVGTTGGTVISSGNDGPLGGYQLVFQHDTGGCGSGPDSGVYIELNDSTPWTYITWEWVGIGVAACWDFTNSSGWGGGAGPTAANLINYDESAGDMVSRSYNSWEYPQFQSHSKVYACDNDSNNFFHGGYQVGNPKSFFMKRRRNSLLSYAGIHHGRSCNNYGVGITTTIRNIRIW